MRVLLFLAGIMMFVGTGCTREEEKELTVESDKQDEIIIVAVGDSLTAGYGLNEEESYPAVLGLKLKSNGYGHCQVINSGVSSETSSGALSRIDWVLGMKPDIVILETGANDGLRGIDPDMVEKNIRDILLRLNDAEVITVLAGMKMVWNLGPVYVKRFNDIYPKLADEFETVFMPFFLEGVAMKREMTIGDGLHPNAEGYKVIVENIYPYVLEAVMKKQK
ncbi:MAG: arylesterase [Desulfobulbaceae bacterium]|nr:arylesterase [Desulfobulbaceae bacterium]